MSAKLELVEANYERAKRRVSELTELITLKREVLERERRRIVEEGGGEVDGQLHGLHEEIEKLERENEEERRFLPVFERRLAELKVENLYALYSRGPAKLDQLAEKHNAKFAAALEHLFGKGGVRDLFKEMAALRKEWKQLFHEWVEARAAWLAAGIKDAERFPPRVGEPTKRLEADGFPRSGSLEQFKWLARSPEAKRHLR